MKEQMLNFLNARKLCVISTVGSDSKPESAMVAYTHDNFELFIGTSSASRKYHNLLDNPLVAIVIADETGEIQYEGSAQLLLEANLTDAEMIQKLPGFEKYRNDPSQTYFHIKPTWIRFIQHGDPDVVEEFTEF